jgi:hypothetical protein
VSDPTRFDTKISVLLSDDLAPWQRLNVTAFLISAIAGARPELLGEAYRDGDGAEYLPMFGQPVMIFEAPAGVLAGARERAASRGLRFAIFTRELFATGNDADNRAAVGAVATEKLDLVGLAVHAPRNIADRIVKGAHLHP